MKLRISKHSHPNGDYYTVDRRIFGLFWVRRTLRSYYHRLLDRMVHETTTHSEAFAEQCFDAFARGEDCAPLPDYKRETIKQTPER